jgi:hypothetical protein
MVRSSPTSTNWKRRSVGIVVCLAPVLLLLASVNAAYDRNWREPFAFVALALGALALASINFYLSFVRPSVASRRHGMQRNGQNISGVPVIGTLLVVLGGVLGFGAIGTTLIGLLAVALDTGGAPWFLLSTWRDSSLWDVSR